MFDQNRNEALKEDSFYSADARTGAEILQAAKNDFGTNADARNFLREAVIHPHELPELKAMASDLYFDIDEFYSSDVSIGSSMLETAKNCFKNDQNAKKFLGRAAAQPHNLPELQKLAGGLFWATQEDFFRHLIRNYPKKDMEDLMQAMAVGFFTWLPKYDPNYAPGTFFATRVLHYAYEEVIKINEIVPEHKIHIKKMILMQREALIREGKPVTVDAILEALPNVSVKDVQDMLPLIGDDGHSMSLDTLGDGGTVFTQTDKRIKSPEEEAIANDRQACFVHALHEVFTERELNILIVYETRMTKLADAKKRLIENYGYADITDDEIRGTWSDAANRIASYSLIHPEYADYLGRFVKLYAVESNKGNIRLEDEADHYNDCWMNDTVNTISDSPQAKLLLQEDDGQLCIPLTGTLPN